eukprot:COSAG01_NODE_6051_length_3879_cov_1.779365_3_plen_91_part_00
MCVCVCVCVLISFIYNLGLTNKPYMTHKGATPLHIAAHLGHTDTVLTLLDAGSSPNRTTRNGATPLLLAAQAGHTQLCARRFHPLLVHCG